TGRALEPEAVERLGDDLPYLADLLPALFERVLRERLEVVDVEERHAEHLTDPGVDIARHGDVDDQERTIATPRHGGFDLAALEEHVGRARRREEHVRLDPVVDRT